LICSWGTPFTSETFTLLTPWNVWAGEEWVHASRNSAMESRERIYPSIQDMVSRGKRWVAPQGLTSTNHWLKPTRGTNTNCTRQVQIIGL
jgi:hypothetical protein